MLRIHVDATRCQQYGQCVLEAPNLFRLTDDGQLDHHATADPSLRADVEAAADVCPMQAITNTDTPDRE